MNKHMEDKLSVTMKEALARNALAENKMKANIHAFNSDSKKMLQSLEFYKHKYEKRQRELQSEKQRMLSRSFDETSSQKISPPSRLMVNIEYTDLSSGGILTDLTELQNKLRQRLYSTTMLSSLNRSENGGKFPALVQSKNEGLTLPAIDRLNVTTHGRQRRLSASDLTGRSLSPGLTVPPTPNITQSKSAPNSPCMPRRAPPSPRSKSPVGNLGNALSLLDDVRKRTVPNLEVAMANLKESRQMQELEERREIEEENARELASRTLQESKDNSKTRKISSPGTTIYSSSREGAGSGDNEKTLEEKMNDMRFCKYLRTTSHESTEELDEGLPNELVPKVIIVGHTEWVPGD